MSVIYQQVKKINMSGGEESNFIAGQEIGINKVGNTYTISNTAEALLDVNSSSAGLTINKDDPRNPELELKLAAGNNVDFQTTTENFLVISSSAPLNTPPVERIKDSQTLPAIVRNLIVSEAATGPVVITLPAASDFPVDNDLFYKFAIGNFSEQDVIIQIADGSSFINSSQKVVLKANPTRPYKAYLNACNFPAAGNFPAKSAWEKEAGVLCKFKARFTGSVPMSTFNTPTPIAFREGNETDNDTVFELDPADDTNILINASCSLQAAFDSTIDAAGFSPTYNVELYVQITRNGAVLPTDPYTRIKTGNFGGEDSAITKVVDFDVFAGDQLKIIQYVTNNAGSSTQGNHIAANLFLRAFV